MKILTHPKCCRGLPPAARVDGGGTVMLMPPGPGVCPECAHKHEPELPHNAQSMYYQMAFKQKRGRWPTEVGL